MAVRRNYTPEHHSVLLDVVENIILFGYHIWEKVEAE